MYNKLNTIYIKLRKYVTRRIIIDELTKKLSLKTVNTKYMTTNVNLKNIWRIVNTIMDDLIIKIQCQPILQF